MRNRRQFVRQTAAVLLAFGLILGLLPGKAAAQDQLARETLTARGASRVPLGGPVLAGKPVSFKLSGNPSNPHWDLEDGAAAEGSSVTHTYQKQGIYRVVTGPKAGGLMITNYPLDKIFIHQAFIKSLGG